MLPGVEFIDETPDVYRWGPLLHGLLNDPYSEDVPTSGPIVMNWSFLFVKGKESIAKEILSRTIQYYFEIGEYGYILENFKF